ncbi:unnamed protein product [Lymnaea stagnalis]|uniref:Ig-like domain-containing protein n=1 Tax=Lymnaea stagnalis TaxID=6523 RepID=A0AAV2H5W2_LYMST
MTCGVFFLCVLLSVALHGVFTQIHNLDVDNTGQQLRGPAFLREPQDTFIMGNATDKVYLECLAVGDPQPSYQWLKLTNDNRTVPLSVDPRYSFTTGSLEIRNPALTDESTYFCKATNDYGTVISSSARLTFGVLGNFSNVPPAPVRGLEYEGATLDCPRIIGKPAKSYQWYKDGDDNPIAPKSLRRAFVSANGKLYFSELDPADEGTYYCRVTLSGFGQPGNYIGASRVDSRKSLGLALTVVTSGDSRYQPIIQDDFIYVFPATPTKGGDVRLECFAYGTGPLNYTWSREGGRPLPIGYALESNGRILLIKNLDFADGGEYTFSVFSSSTELLYSKAIDLAIQAKPYFTYPLTHQDVDVGSRLTWHCEAAGRPTPTYQWYKNGEVLKSSPGITVDVNTLTITTVDGKRDNGTYQCAASNSFGTTFTTAQLRV